MLTARGQKKDRELAERYGVSRFMTKPFANAEILASVRELRGPADEAAGRAAVPGPAGLSPAPAGAMRRGCCRCWARCCSCCRCLGAGADRAHAPSGGGLYLFAVWLVLIVAAGGAQPGAGQPAGRRDRAARRRGPLMHVVEPSARRLPGLCRLLFLVAFARREAGRARPGRLAALARWSTPCRCRSTAPPGPSTARSAMPPGRGWNS